MCVAVKAPVVLLLLSPGGTAFEEQGKVLFFKQVLSTLLSHFYKRCCSAVKTFPQLVVRYPAHVEGQSIGTRSVPEMFAGIFFLSKRVRNTSIYFIVIF